MKWQYFVPDHRDHWMDRRPELVRHLWEVMSSIHKVSNDYDGPELSQISEYWMEVVLAFRKVCLNVLPFIQPFNLSATCSSKGLILNMVQHEKMIRHERSFQIVMFFSFLLDAEPIVAHIFDRHLMYRFDSARPHRRSESQVYLNAPSSNERYVSCFASHKSALDHKPLSTANGLLSSDLYILCT